MLRSLLLLLSFVLLLPAPVLSQEATLADVVATLESPFKPANASQAAGAKGRIADFQADFFQESQVVAIDRVQRGEGQVSFKFQPAEDGLRPLAMFRWEYRQPMEQELVSDGETLWYYLPENRQVIVSELHSDTDQQENPATILSGLGNLSQDFNIGWGTPREDEDGNYQLEMTPHHPSQYLRALQISVDGTAVRNFMKDPAATARFPILATRVTDANGNQTRIEFRNVKTNRNLARQFFRFTPPEGVDVVHPETAFSRP
jgi:outer membrane lipoprotein carrier protein